MPNEIGASICGWPNGDLAFGPWSEGTPVGVDITVKCPPGTNFLGIYHTHPNGVAAPSAQDIKSGLAVNAKYLCISVPGEGDLRCYRKR